MSGCAAPVAAAPIRRSQRARAILQPSGGPAWRRAGLDYGRITRGTRAVSYASCSKEVQNAATCAARRLSPSSRPRRPPGTGEPSGRSIRRSRRRCPRSNRTPRVAAGPQGEALAVKQAEIVNAGLRSSRIRGPAHSQPRGRHTPNRVGQLFTQHAETGDRRLTGISPQVMRHRRLPQPQRHRPRGPLQSDGASGDSQRSSGGRSA